MTFTLASLATTIFYAERLGHLYDLEASGAIKHVHLFLAKLTAAAYLAPVLTGVWTIRHKDRAFRWHKLCAYVVLALTVVTAVTGAWMILASERLPDVA